jgi:hypothetical protein
MNYNVTSPLYLYGDALRVADEFKHHCFYVYD